MTYLVKSHAAASGARKSKKKEKNTDVHWRHEKLRKKESARSSMSIDHQNQPCFDSKPVHAIIFFQISNLEKINQIPSSAPPPKLHYTTFWRSVARRIYNRRFEETRQNQREPIYFYEHNMKQSIECTP